MANDSTTNIIKYGSRTFGEIRTDLIAYIRQTYPTVFQDFTDSNIGQLLIDLNAGVGNNLSYNTDRVFQETQLEYAQLRTSLLNHAKTLGFNIPAKRPSVTVVDFTVAIPVLGDRPDTSYYPTLDAGAQIVGAGKVFETLDVIDWNSSVSTLGDANRSIIPVLDSNGIVVSYQVTKREVVTNGTTTIYKKVITADDVKSFYSIVLPDANVIEIESIILLEGTSYANNPSDSEFSTSTNRFYEVDYLAQQRVFVENTNSSAENSNTNNLKAATWINTTKKFIKEFTTNGYCKLTFGSGDADVDAFKNGLIKAGVTNKAFLDNFLNNTALGEKLIAGYTLFVKYKVGGGVDSNVGTNVLKSMGNFTLNCTGSRQDYRQTTIRSLSVSNPIPAIGGNDGLSIEQIRYLIKYNFSAQQRAVALTDYLLQVYKMPGKFGSPFRVITQKVNNKVVIPILDIGSDGKLSNSSNSLLKENIAEYLSEYRMMNDYIEIRDGKIFNLAFDVDIYVENISDSQIANNVITTVRDYFDINESEMNQDVFLGQLQNEITKVNGVINVIEIKVYNKVGGQYSINTVSQDLLSTTTGLIQIINNTIYSNEDSMFEVKYPEKDIRVYLRKKVST